MAYHVVMQLSDMRWQWILEQKLFYRAFADMLLIFASMYDAILWFEIEKLTDV